MNTPDVVTSAVMALEKWIEERIEADEPISGVVETILTNGRSLAFAGVLINLGKRYHSLLTSEIRPLLFVHDFYLLALRGPCGFRQLPSRASAIRANNLRSPRMSHPGAVCKGWLHYKFAPYVQGADES